VAFEDISRVLTSNVVNLSTIQVFNFTRKHKFKIE